MLLAILYVSEDNTKDASKVIRKVIKLFDGEISADYAEGLSEAIENGNERDYIASVAYNEKGLFGEISISAVVSMTQNLT